MLRKAVEKRPSNTGEGHSLPLSLLNGKNRLERKGGRNKGRGFSIFFLGGWQYFLF